jgi:phosphoribosylpyrophosphate synthetase
LLKIVSGTANVALSQGIARQLGLHLEPTSIGQFADGEINLQLLNNVRGSDIFIIQPTCTDVNKNLMELLLLIHTLKLSSAKRITAVIPYFGYARQDRKTKPRVPISAAAVAQLIEKMGPHRVVSQEKMSPVRSHSTDRSLLTCIVDKSKASSRRHRSITSSQRTSLSSTSSTRTLTSPRYVTAPSTSSCHSPRASW